MHGAGGRGGNWRLVAAELQGHGHEVLAVDLPCDQPVGLGEYAETVVDAIGTRRGGVVLVAQSLSGFIAPLVCQRVPVDLMVLVAAMVPRPGESGGDWWVNTGQGAAFAAQNLPDDSEETVYTHDVPAEVLATLDPPRDQTGTLFEEPWPLPAWPDVPTRFLLCRDDRLFPANWLRGIVKERLGVEPIEIPGGHCAYLSQPGPLATAVLRCWDEVRERSSDHVDAHLP